MFRFQVKFHSKSLHLYILWFFAIFYCETEECIADQGDLLILCLSVLKYYMLSQNNWRKMLINTEVYG